MKNMFYNYDNNINKKSYPDPIHFPERTKILESDNNVELVCDINGNEIGVKVKHNNDFALFFSLDGEVEGSSIAELVYNSTIVFEVIDTFHNVVLTKDFTADKCFMPGFDTIRIEINQDESAKLLAESYGMRLTLCYPGGSYELFSERNGKLIVR